MSQTFLDIRQTVGYDLEKQMLIVTISEKMAKKLMSDGWDISYEKEIGHFVTFELSELTK